MVERYISYLNRTGENIIDMMWDTEPNITELKELMYPIGKVEIFRDNDDHSTFMGFTWQRCLSGRFPVGLDTENNDPDFSTCTQQGGEKTHTLTTDEVPQLNMDGKPIGIDSTSQHVNGYSGNAPTAHNNLPPYEVVAFWVRVS